MEQVRVAMSFFELLKLPLVFTDDGWIVDMRHGLIVPLIIRIRIRASANKLRSAARPTLPAIAGPAPSDEPTYDDDYLRKGYPEVDYPPPHLGAPHKLLVGVVPGARPLHHPPFCGLQGSWLTPLGDHSVQATVL